MANLPETPIYDAGVYQKETTDIALGGPDGKANEGARNLANRTAYLKQQVDVLVATKAPLASPPLTGNPTAPTQALGDVSTKIATDEFVQKTVGGVLSKSVAGGSNVTLTAVEAGHGILQFTGILTGNVAVIVPVSPTRSWVVKNDTTGAFALTIKTPAGTGVVVLPGTSITLWCDGTNVYSTMLPLGYNQTNQNMLASRAPSTTYTNSTGGPIGVHIRASSSATSSWLVVTLTTTAGAVITYSSASESAVNFSTSVGLIVLHGETYSAAMVSGVTTLAEWNELR
ncbi:hypothetical protein [Methylobacter tundripaludum]|uniref:Uncharacterized protein n=1 Tax=Methylobacter tundripaludum (strain ATCC BAA-1195 / DSM 17260 / SV96) TaxID=697282 RepID=G3IRF5_METTV|nr:hypothetical protein [Methylobacter tundripaludum]EGW22166.1 hypothetical protein Mettu_0967 [Methylobacter tundripaludum SV96]